MELSANLNECFLQKLRLENYRCFAELDVAFENSLTVFVAPNGGGKTAVLDAVSVALRLFVDTIEGRTTSKGFDAKDIRLVLTRENMMEPVTPVRLLASGFILGEQISWARERQSEKASRTTTAEALELKKIASRLTLKNQQWSVLKDKTWGEIKNQPLYPVFPLISYYGTGRLWSTSKLTEGKRANLSAPNARYRGYTDCLSSYSHYKYFIDWFRRFSYEAKKTTRKTDSIHEPERVLSAVCKAVDIALAPSEWFGLEWDFAEDVIVANHPKHGRLPVDVLSDGIRNIVGLVADIAHRMARLNPQLGERAAFETPGVVLIDEVDMHLHPEWQQVILASLRSAFPRVQLIVTTHSPQVLSTLRKENIRILITDDDGKWTAIQPSKSPLGQESGDALANIMETHPRPDLPDILEKLHTYEQLVRAGQGRHLEANKILTELSEAGFEFRDADKALFEFLMKKAAEDNKK